MLPFISTTHQNKQNSSDLSVTTKSYPYLSNVYTFDTHEDAAKKILELVRDGDTILFKASHVMHMEKIIELI